MRINDERYFFNHQDNDDIHTLTKVSDINIFHKFPGRGNKKPNQDKNETPCKITDFFKVYFDDLINQGKKEYKNSQIEVKFMGEGKLQWLLLNGVMKGCTLYIYWKENKINIEIYAQPNVFSRLSKIKNYLYRSISKRYSKCIIEIKVLQNAKFS